MKLRTYPICIFIVDIVLKVIYLKPKIFSIEPITNTTSMFPKLNPYNFMCDMFDC